MLNEKKLTKAELDKREDIIMKMKKNKRSLVDKYGKDAEAVMYGRATNMAKKQSESMKNDRLNELIKDSLTNPKSADLDKQDSKQEDLVALVRELDPNEYEVYAFDAEVDPEDADQMMDWIYSLTDSEVEVEIKKLEGVNEDKLAAIKEDLKETLDDDVWMKVDALKNNLRGDELIDVIVRAMSTDDANLYLDAIMRDYDIDIELPRDKMDPISSKFSEPLGEASDEKIDKEEKKKGPTAKQLKDILDRISLLNPKAKLGPLQKLAKIGDIKETIKQMRSINEKDYPFDKCLDDNEGKYGKKGAAKVCGSIRAAFGEGLKEGYIGDENFEDQKGTADQKLWVIAKLEEAGIINDSNKKKALKVVGHPGSIDEGLPKGYFKKEFGIGKKKKLKEATGPATIEDTEKAARKVVAAIKLEEPDSKVEISFGLDEGSFDIDLDDQPYDGGSYTVDSDGDITLVSIRKPGFVGNLNDAPSTIQATMNDILAA